MTFTNALPPTQHKMELESKPPIGPSEHITRNVLREKCLSRNLHGITSIKFSLLSSYFNQFYLLYQSYSGQFSQSKLLLSHAIAGYQFVENAERWDIRQMHVQLDSLINWNALWLIRTRLNVESRWFRGGWVQYRLFVPEDED